MTATTASELTLLPKIIGASTAVPLLTGEYVSYANLDHAASAPCLVSVRDAIDELLPYYASVHRGAGFSSYLCTQIYERARTTMRQFVGAHARDTVIFTRNSTDAFNLLAKAVPRGTSVLTFDTDHHAALLPWRGSLVQRIATPTRVTDIASVLQDALVRCPEGPRLVVLTGASNVTGELWPIADLTSIAHQHGARIVLDAAQLAPHRPIQTQDLGVDYVVLSGHKLYAPFGAGALIGRTDWLNAAEPYLMGGGATKHVDVLGNQLGVSWNRAPERHEAGTPNVLGAHALAVACRTLLDAGWETIIAHENELLSHLRVGLATIPGLQELSIFGAKHDRVAVVSFTIARQDPALLAAALSAEYGIGVRDGAFCAHIATRRLLKVIGSSAERALRVSLGLGTTAEHISRLLHALQELTSNGPRSEYQQLDGRWLPVRDTRLLPTFASS